MALGVVYFLIGTVSAALANPAESNQVRVMWRLAAWAASAAVYGAHIGYEHFRLRNLPRRTALHAAAAVAIGAFALAVAAAMHALVTGSGNPRFIAALVIWPAISAAPAFLVALGLGAVLSQLPRSA